jgi:hypothetical protein
MASFIELCLKLYGAINISFFLFYFLHQYYYLLVGLCRRRRVLGHVTVTMFYHLGFRVLLCLLSRESVYTSFTFHILYLPSPKALTSTSPSQFHTPVTQPLPYCYHLLHPVHDIVFSYLLLA